MMKLLKRTGALLVVIALMMVALPLNALAAADVVDFEDGKFDAFYIKEDDGDPSILSVVDFNGSKALFIDSQESGTPKVVIDVKALVGADNLDKVRGVQFDLVVTQPDSDTVPWQGGAIGANQGEDAAHWYQGQEWTLQDDEKSTSDVKTISTKFDGNSGFVNDTDAMYLFMNWGNSGSDMYVDNVKFLAEDGSAIALASGSGSAEAPVDTETSVLPKTGEQFGKLYYAIGGLVILAGLIVVVAKRRGRVAN